MFKIWGLLLILLLFMPTGYAAPRPGQCEAQGLLTNAGGLDVRLQKSGSSDVILTGDIIYTGDPPRAYEAYLEYMLVCAPLNNSSSYISAVADRLESQPGYMSSYRRIMDRYNPYRVDDFANVNSFNQSNPDELLEVSFGLLSAQTHDIAGRQKWRYYGSTMKIIVTTILQGGLGFQAHGNPCDPMPIGGEFIYFENERGQRVGSYRFNFTVHNRTPQCLNPDPDPDPDPDPPVITPPPPPPPTCNRGVFKISAPRVVNFGEIRKKDAQQGRVYLQDFEMSITKEDNRKECIIDVTPRVTFESNKLLDNTSVDLQNGLMLKLKTKGDYAIEFGKQMDAETIPGDNNAFSIRKKFIAEIQKIPGMTVQNGDFEGTVIYKVEYR